MLGKVLVVLVVTSSFVAFVTKYVESCWKLFLYILGRVFNSLKLSSMSSALSCIQTLYEW
jgi:hypothetical protein